MKASRLFVLLLLIGMIAIMSVSDWLDPNWRYQLSNAVIAWAAVGVLAGLVAVAWFGVRQIPKTSVVVAVVMCAIAGAAAGGIGGGLLWAFTHRAAPEPANKVPASPVALFMESTWVPLPLTVSPESSIHIVPLNQKRMQTVKWGFQDVFNNSQSPMQWPSAAKMAESGKQFNPGIFVVRCDLTNAGDNTLIDITVPIDVHFEGIADGNTRYNAIVTPLKAGERFTFYLVNDCSPNVSAIWQDNAVVQVLGEDSRRTVPLRRKFKSPVDQIMMLFGTKTRWIGGDPCA